MSGNNRAIICNMFNLRRQDVALIYNGASVSPRHPASDHDTIRARCRRALGLRNDQLVLLTTARLSRQKGQRYLIEAAPQILARHPDTVFLFVGEGDARRELEAKVAEDNVTEHIQFLGHRDDLEELSLAADLFVFPTVFEGSPFALMEAMAYGIPIVTTNASGIPEVVRHHQDGIVVEKENSRALLDGVLFAASNLGRMREMASSARERVREFSGDKMATDTLNLLEKIQIREAERA